MRSLEQINSNNLENGNAAKNLYELDEYLSLSEEQKKDLEDMISKLLNSKKEYDVILAISIQQKNKFPTKIINASMTSDTIKQGLALLINDPRPEVTEAFIELFNVNENIVKDAVKIGIIKFCCELGHTHTTHLKYLKEKFNLSDVDFQEAIEQGFSMGLSKLYKECSDSGTTNYDNVLYNKDRLGLLQKLKQNFNISEEMLQKKTTQVVEEYFIKGDLENVKRVLNEFNISKKVIIDLFEIQESAKLGVINLLSENKFFDAKKMVEYLDLSDDAIKNICRKAIISILSKGNIDVVMEIIKEFDMSEEMSSDDKTKENQQNDLITTGADIHSSLRMINLPEIQEAAKLGVINRLLNGSINSPLKIKETFQLSDKIINSQDVQDAIKICIEKNLTSGRWAIESVVNLKNAFSVSQDFIDASREIQESIKVRIKQDLSEHEIYVISKIKNEIGISQTIINSIDVQESIKETMIYFLSTGNTQDTNKIIKIFDVSRNVIKETGKIGIQNVLSEGMDLWVDVIIRELNLDPEIIHLPEIQEAVKHGLIQHLSQNKIDKARNLKEKFFDNLLQGKDIDYCMENKKLSAIDFGEEFFDKSCDELFSNAKELNVFPSEYYFIKDDIQKLKVMGVEARSEYIFDKLKGNHENWTDEQNILIPFRTGSEIFGFSKMFEYINRANISKHDSLHNFLKVIDIYNKSELSSNEFFNNILMQVKNDTSTYNEGTSYHKLNSIVNTINIDFEATIKNAKEYGLPTLDKLLEEIQSSKDIFSSWKMLKKYNDLCQILNRREVLEQLKELETKGDIDLYKYIETLAFHPNIEMQKVIEFWKNPEEFLEISDTHTPDEVHKRKKPSNYINFPNLDLSAEDLRDALVRGYYDNLQVFEPLEINYKIMIDAGKYGNLELNNLILKAIGKRKEGIKGEAKNADKLFNELQKLFKENDINIILYLQSGKIEEDKIETLENIKDKIIELIYDKNIGLEDDRKFEEYRAKINLKSDPDGVVAGNDTSCCMPFGSGKNNVYTFNPICSLFTVQKLTESNDNKEEKYRTVAQSVLTKDIDVGKNVSEIVGQLNKFEAHMSDIISDDVLIDKQSIITCDNIEVSPNFKSQKDNTELLKIIYADFFKEYIKQFAKKYNLDEGKLIIGLGYTDANISLDRIENTFVPEAPVGYSDNLRNESMLLDLTLKNIKSIIASKRTIIQEKKTIRPEQTDAQLPKGISDLTFQDSIKVAYIEGKAYKDNEKLIEYLHNMENALIAKDVNNAIKDRPNMSFKYTGEDKKMHGYILAYEGKMNKNDSNSESIVYVSDLASDGNLRAGGSLILGFVDAYKKNYIDKSNTIPIFAQFREQTSYQIIMKQLDKLSKETGVQFEADELGTYQVGNDTMHQVIIRAKK